VAPLDASGEPGQAVGIRRRGADLAPRAALIEHAVVAPPAAEIQSSVHREGGPPSGSLLDDTPERATREALLHDIQLSVSELSTER
jgi:hypothetical protein